MADYTKYPKGSEWRKWDLHIHTPSSYDYEDKSITDEAIIEKLKENNICVVAVTDHHIIDITKINNLRQLAGDDLTILAGIELRSELGGSESIHFIGIFPQDSDTFKLKDAWIELQGKFQLTPNQVKEKGDDKVYCDLKEVAEVVQKLGGIITIHAGSKSNSIERITNALPYKEAQKEEVASNVDIFEMGKVDDLNEYHKYVFPSIDRIYPMIICSDNHNIRNYELKSNCWIKADPTFEGLKQIIYEPKDRVKIQAERPEEKDSYSVIKSVRFIDKREKSEFDEAKILLNPNLNSIIGGKSSGKSLLLYHIAKTIDAERISSINEKRGIHQKIEYLFEEADNFDFEVEWEDGKAYKLKDIGKPNRPITYIPQLYLNRLAEDQKAELNNLVDKMLLDSSEEYKNFRSDNKEEINRLNKDSFTAVDSYYRTKEELATKKKELRELGDKIAIAENIKQIDQKMDQLRKESSFTKEDEKKYKELTAEKNNLENNLSKIATFINVLETAQGEFDSLKKDIPNILNEKIFSKLSSISHTLSEEVNDKIQSIIDSIGGKLILTLETEIKNNFSCVDEEKIKQQELKDQLKNVNDKLIPLAAKVKNKESFAQQQKKREEENTKLQKFEEKEATIKKIVGFLSAREIHEKYCEMFKRYKTIVEKNGEYKSIPDTENLELTSSIKLDNEKFNKNFLEKIDKRTPLSEQFGNYFNGKGEYSFESTKHLDNIKDMIDKITSGKISFRAGFDEKIVLLSLLNDYFSIDYNLLQDGDDLIRMSPGKRGIILFQLFLHLSKSTNPILIDQPEDNLDNRTVYQELNDFIKTKKTRRQIIIVSHNPNLVVSTDSENIIVANQDGQNKSGKNLKYKFEYVNGAIEYSFSDDTKEGILFKRGIREHVCEILEGGAEAFEKREKKYGFK